MVHSILRYIEEWEFPAGLSQAIQSLLQDVSGSVWCFASDARVTLKIPHISVNSVQGSMCFVLQGEVDEFDKRHFGFWRSLLRWQNTSQNACYEREKQKKMNPIPIFLWWMKISEAVCKYCWQCEVVFFFQRANISDSVCDDPKLTITQLLCSLKYIFFSCFHIYARWLPSFLEHCSLAKSQTLVRDMGRKETQTVSLLVSSKLFV